VRPRGSLQSAFSDWRAGHTHQPGETERTDAELLAAIRRLHADSGEADGVWRISAALCREGWQVNHTRVQGLMADHGLAGHRPGQAPLDDQA
jgi:hypothetical protein